MRQTHGIFILKEVALMAQIHPQTRIGAVSLTIHNLERSLAYYQERLGFQLHRQEGRVAYLGAGGPDLLVLHEAPDAPEPAPNATGLYHFAVLVPSRRHLALSLRHLAETRTPLQGFADHLVSEAIYLGDPDGNGIEIYRDRPRDEWPYEDKQLLMASDPLDFDGIMAELNGKDEAFSGLHVDTTIGHIHLKVHNIPETDRFYQGVLGFDLMLHFGPRATFLSAGGYHHHLGANTWHSAGGPPPPTGTIGLRSYEVVLPDEAALDEVVKRVEAAGRHIEQTNGGYRVQDPSQNTILLRAEN